MGRTLGIFLALICFSAFGQQLDHSEFDLSRYYLVNDISDWNGSGMVVRRFGNGSGIVFLNSAPEINPDRIRPLGSDWKLSARVANRSFTEGRYNVVFRVPIDLRDFQTKVDHHTYVLYLSDNAALENWQSNENVIYIDGPLLSPVTEAVVTNLDLTVNKVNAARDLSSKLGEGLNISVKEDAFSNDDIDLVGRVFDTGLGSPQVSVHAGEMATIIAGAGNRANNSLGAVPKARLTSSDFNRIFPDPEAVFMNNAIYLQNHSYGFTMPNNQYGAESAAYDEQMNANQELVHVMSAGNLGEATPAIGIYAGIPGVSNISGSFKMAKSPILVGATSAQGEIDRRNSRGPAYDGRIKPEVVAYGVDGTSDAAAVVSGLAALLQEKYVEMYGVFPSSALLKAMLIAGADDAGAPGLDYVTGYGQVNAMSSLDIINKEHFFNGEVRSGEESTWQIEIPENVRSVRLVLAWNDLAANPGDAVALVNDLDLVLEKPSSENISPWILSTFPHPDSLAKPAIHGEDHLNVVETITLEAPVPGRYLAKVTGTSVQGAQSFALALLMEEEGDFRWIYPLDDDAVQAGKQLTIRWDGGMDATRTIEYRLNGGMWNTLGEVNELKERFDWMLPDTTAITQLRIDQSGTYIESGEFIVTPPVELRTEVVCDDSVVFTWNSLPGINEYQLFTTGNANLSLVESTTDTLISIAQKDVPGGWVRVYPVIDNKRGFGNPAIEFSRQGVNCYYVNAFSRNVEDRFIRSEVTLSTLIGVKSVTFERSIDGGFFEIMQVQEVQKGVPVYLFDDFEPLAEFSVYRIMLSLSNGQMLELSRTQVYFPFEETFAVYPNPVASGGFFTLLTLPEDKEVRMLNVYGQVIRRWPVFANRSEFDLPFVGQGIYIIQVLREGKGMGSFRLMIE